MRCAYTYRNSESILLSLLLLLFTLTANVFLPSGTGATIRNKTEMCSNVTEQL
jgi:hypothetical protein